MADKDKITPLAKEKSFLIEQTVAVLLIGSVAYSFFSHSTIGWIIAVIIIIIYSLYSLFRKKSEGKESIFEQLTRSRRENAEIKRREKMERESLAREKWEKQRLKAKEIDTLEKRRLDEKFKLEKERGTEKLEGKKISEEQKKYRDVEKLGLSKTKEPEIGEKTLTQGSPIKAKDKVGELESNLEKQLENNLKQRGDRTEEEAKLFAKNFTKALNLDKIFDSIAETLMIATEKAIEMVFDVVKEGVEGLAKTAFSEKQVNPKRVVEARENLINTGVKKGAMLKMEKFREHQNKSKGAEKPIKYSQRSFSGREENKNIGRNRDERIR